MDKWKKRYIREKQARKDAEKIVEEKSLKLYQAMQDLAIHNDELKKTISKKVLLYKKATEKAKLISNRKTEFIENISHDLRTPLSAIVGLCELIKKDDKDNEYINLILKSCQNQSYLLDEILDISRIEQGKFKLNEKDFSINNFLKDIIDTHKCIFLEKNNTLKIKMSNNIQNLVSGDANRIRQVLHNFITNAQKNTIDGIIIIDVTQTEINKDFCKLNFSVQDNGKGIKKTDIKKLLKRYSQNNDDNTMLGIGIGLSICNQLIKQLGGKMKIKSNQKDFTSFSFEIKLKINNNIKNNLIRHQSSKNDLKILCVEDDAINMHVLKKRLDYFASEVHTAQNGLEAFIKVKKNSYDYIFLDIQMPQMNGYEFLKEISKIKTKATIVVMTANTLKLDINYCNKYGVNNFLSKPFTEEKIVKIIKV